MKEHLSEKKKKKKKVWAFDISNWKDIKWDICKWKQKYKKVREIEWNYFSSLNPMPCKLLVEFEADKIKSRLAKFYNSCRNKL